MGTAITKQTSITIHAPTHLVWSVFTDVEQWASWTSSVTSVELLDGPLRVGARARIRQPKLPTVTWTVTQFDEGNSWTWAADSPGAHTTAAHVLSAHGDATVALQTIVQGGPIGWLVGRVYGRLTERYLQLEAQGLKRQCEQVATRPSDADT